MTQYLEHITTEGERWDSIAWKYYGDVTQMGLLIETNPQAPIKPTLPAGMKLLIPLIEQPKEVQGLPPWK
ncbi:hypothetical protein COW36_09000 [bacterium (Candidatus Blackallbacteria) CG17_big_fil_post_rev_8_21_14_2_50_48_46]|uniref:Phage tail protein n=1 Tax=bacterium (Candidatus Blackallbacteria) CG17_big_fil_post_rev_8_21_14_2_50_48_46 TaxID=2014261 RepID=A0A2M7G604_9BACT|nr:MAG: hypothetical protein COW64_24050 [bacterium (Candidatus Blackallbacteria) CG18_big_fil_WC_8_21_14_2_50_49_26]PIW17306.1 MAG: hypothetical protein COW36_09000 [bacterium (Candidatus Blackallbacteria) CG17_big_fil_post_rev_8_21_14_2_50_48_46]PIW47463.1 MAG: hypothetical protein COW20_12830 [bacterium (Candidatus Blackallbacteria) CG13_big_fil_rev_8_21_14_2_50_49_14]